ncbi:hypothetical protein EDD17DRAFT_1760649 [Pisolithus thermaeus]|nr:hypothetical protein EV401DRAFT_2074015 [Pisolithus croceorrhizus]KAI6160509.1 hypothetical protein EDD17DRAFT_1760649 [Pisolithus thermaeus]
MGVQDAQLAAQMGHCLLLAVKLMLINSHVWEIFWQLPLAAMGKDAHPSTCV